MSWQATAWAKATRDHRSHGEKLILFILADYAHPETWIAWPSILTLANDAEMSGRNVKRCLQSLEKRQFILRLQRGNQYKTSEYLLRGPGVDVTNYLHSTPSVSDISSPSHEGAMSNNGSAMSNREGDLSSTDEGDISSAVIRNEYPSGNAPSETKEPPQWWVILGRDKRWPKEYDAKWGDTVLEQYGPPIDLEAEAFKAATWLGTAKGLKRTPRGMKTFWLNWLGRVAADHRPTPSKARANTVEDVRKAKARRHGTN